MVIKRLAPGVMVVGRFEPDPITELGFGTIWRGVHKQVPFLNGTEGNVRDPETNNRLKTNQVASNWHRDTSDHDTAMVLWSNKEQTQILLPDGTIIQPDPCDIVVIHNEKVMHRTPSEMSADRWFFRAHIRAPQWL